MDILSTLEDKREEKKLDNLVRALGRDRLPLRSPCMEGTRFDILHQIETEIERTVGHNVIWIRGSPGVGKSALAASITVRLQSRGRHVIWFRFDRTQSTTITTEALWRVVACSLARWYPSLRQQMARGNTEISSSNIDHLFETLIEKPLSTLDDIPYKKLPVIVIDALDECGGLRHDSSGRDDYDGLLRTLRRWALVDHLRKFKLIITSRLEDRITQTFPESNSTYINILSGSGVKPGDSASKDISLFLMSRLSEMGMKEAWVNEAHRYLVPRAAGMFIWATTVADFLEIDPKQRFHILQTKEQERGAGTFTVLNSLYATVVETLFGHGLEEEEEEIKAVTSVLGATVFAKQPLNDSMLMKLPGVKSLAMLKSIRNGLESVIDSGPILHFHHRSFEDFLLSRFFQQQLPNLSDIQDRNLHERQLATLCLNCMVSSELRFNMCNLDSSSIENVDIPWDNKSAISPLISYSSQFWADHLVQTQCEEISMKKVEFVMYEKLLFWIEVMSILGKAHKMSAILKRALEWPRLAVCPESISCNTTLRLTDQTFNSGNKLTSFIRDALRFISAFLIPISQSTPQIYLSALPFAPEHSLVAERFRQRFPNILTISDGRPSRWPMIVFVAEHHKYPVRCIVSSSDDKTFASVSENGVIYVCDSATGHCTSGSFQLRNVDLSDWGTGLDVCFSPDGKHILVRCRPETILSCHAIVWDTERGEEVLQIEGFDFVFIHHGRYKGKIASMHWTDEDGFLIQAIARGVQRPTRIQVQLWDVRNGISDRLFDVANVTVAQFSPNGQYLAIGRRSKNAVKLRNLEDGKVTHRFPYPLGNISSLHFSSTSDYLVVVFGEPPEKRLWRLGTDRTIPFDVGYDSPAVIHTNHVFVPRDNTVEIWEITETGSHMIFKTEPLTTSSITSIYLSITRLSQAFGWKS